MNIVNNLLLRAHLPESEDPRRNGITLINHPMNRTRFQLASNTLYAALLFNLSREMYHVSYFCDT